MAILFYILFFVLGLSLGSFVNMLVYRTADRYKLERRKFKPKKKERSFCDYCGKQLSWYENIPILSWCVQRGRSRCCHKKLSLLYPIVEIFTGLLMVFVVQRFDLINFDLPIMVELLRVFWLMILVVFLVFLMVFDLKYLILPNFAVIILIIISLLGVIFDEPNIVPYLLSAVGSSIFLLFLNLITKGKGMGFGDVKLAVFMGLFLGWPKIILAMYMAFILGAIIGIVLMMFKKVTGRTKIPFGPFLILGTLISWIYGNEILKLSVFQFFR